MIDIRLEFGGLIDMMLRVGKNKYGAQKTTMCGRTFDSRREAEYYLELLEKKKRGEVTIIGFQPFYTLLEGFTDNTGKRHRPITYTADFLVIYADGHTEVVEVKGVRTRDYILRKKLFLHKMRGTGLIFREVR
jgi:hypothetical protein|nr:MAG TPA: Endonuclease [Caudoviricetes sp.]